MSEINDPNRPVLHIVVTGFHHQRGSKVEFAYPPLIEGEECNSPKLPEQWHHLPFISLPEGAHNYEADGVFFMLPSLGKWSAGTDQTCTVYGISCYRQISSKASQDWIALDCAAAKQQKKMLQNLMHLPTAEQYLHQVNITELKNRHEDVTRTTVQKSVCILSQLPLFGYIQTKLEVATRVYFSERDFSKTEILKELYKNLNSSLSPSMLDPELLFVGLSTADLLIVFGQRNTDPSEDMIALLPTGSCVIQASVAGEKGTVIFYGFPVKKICSFMLTLVSLIPGMIRSGLCMAASGESSPVPLVPEPVDEEPLFQSLSESEARGISVDQYGLPLDIFGKGATLHPYFSLQQMNTIKQPSARSFWIGASNVLYKQQRHISDVLVDVNTGAIDIHDPELKQQLALSSADLRFTDYLLQHLANYAALEDEQNVGWDGSEEWIRAQFKMYLFSLLSTTRHTGESMSNFNSGFVSAWKKTHHFSVWNSKAHSGVDDVHAGHPFQGQMGIADIKIRLANTMQDVASKNMGKAVGGAISGARSFIASWLSDITQESPEEENEANNCEVPIEEELQRT